MRIDISFHSENNILVLPLSYHHCLQALIYNMMGDSAKDLHSKIVFKPFVFSQLKGEYILDNKNKIITFSSNVTFSIASLDNRLLMVIMSNCFKNKNTYYLMKQTIVIDSISPKEINIKEGQFYHIKMLSPITIHKTIEIDGRKRTNYLKPDNDDFITAINDNLNHKLSFYNKDIGIAQIYLHSIGKVKEVCTLYKNYSIIGYMCDFVLKCNIDLLHFLLDVGLGDKNSQGFGFFEVVENNYEKNN